MITFSVKRECSLEVLKNFVAVIAPLFCLVIMLHFFHNGWRGFCLRDDNLKQWIHIINAGLNQFFHGKGMPFYNFFIYEGVEIYDEGYYGLYNPLMWIAFLLGKIIGAETISLYIFLLIFCGNLVIYKITAENKLPYGMRFLVVFSFTFLPIFYYQGQRWYYVWNNYLVVPLIIYSLNIWKRLSVRKNIFLIAFIFLLSVTLGNAQYTFMSFISWGILTFFTLKNNKKYLFYFICGWLIGGMLSMPFIWGLLSAAKRGRCISHNFFSSPIHPLRYLFFTLLPDNNSLKTMFYDIFLPKQHYVADYYQYCISFLFLGIFGFLTLGFVFHFKKNKNIFAMQCLFLFLFWTIYMGGEEFILASLLYHVPLVKMFEHLFKAVYIMPSFLVLPACVEIKYLEEKYFSKKNAKYVIYATFIFLLLFQIYEANRANGEYYRMNDYSYIKHFSKSINIKDYRFLFFTDNGDDVWSLYPIPYINSTVTAKLQTVGGFEPFHGAVSNSMLDLYAGVDWMRMTHGNCIVKNEVLKYFDDDDNNVSKFAAALRQNSVRYIITRNSELTDFSDRLLSAGVSIKKIDYNDDVNVYIYEFSNIPAIATDEKGGALNIESIELDRLKIQLPNHALTKIVLRERFNKHLKAYHVLKSGHRDKLDLFAASDTVEILFSENSEFGGSVIVRYENCIYSIGVCITIILLLAIIVFFLNLMLPSNCLFRRHDKIVNKQAVM